MTDIEPTFAKGWIRRASALQALGRLKDAITAYDEAIKLEPDAKAFQKARKQVKDAVRVGERLWLRGRRFNGARFSDANSLL